MKMSSTSTITRCAMIAAVYVALVMVLPFLSFGPIQIRIAEALTLLPVLSVMPIWGVAIGCVLANFIGFMTGANILGFVDVFVGTAASFAAAWTSYAVRHVRFYGIPFLAAVPPVLYNAVAVGAQLMWYFVGEWNTAVFLTNAMYVGIGQIIACFGLGLPLLYVIERKPELAEKFK